MFSANYFGSTPNAAKRQEGRKQATTASSQVASEQTRSNMKRQTPQSDRKQATTACKKQHETSLRMPTMANLPTHK